MAIEKDEIEAADLKEKLQKYQELKEDYELQKDELKQEGLEQKNSIDKDSRRMNNQGSLEICQQS